MTQAEAASAYGVSKGWVSKLMARYRAEGPAAYEPRSRRPKSSPTATPVEVVELIVRLRKEPLVNGKEPKDIAPVVARTLLSKNAPGWAFERLVESMSMLPPIIAWNSSSPVVNCTVSNSTPCFAKLPRSTPVQIWPSTASVCR